MTTNERTLPLPETKTITVDVSVRADPLGIEILGDADEDFVLHPETIKQAAEANPPEAPGDYHLTIEYSRERNIVGTEWTAHTDSLRGPVMTGANDSSERLAR